MTNLFDSAVLMIEQPSARLNYRITDPQGAPLASVTQVAGREPKTGLGGLLSGYPDRSRVVVRVDGPGGNPLFFVDRAEHVGPAPEQPPSAIVAPDGRLIGRIEHDVSSMARSFLEGTSWMPGARSTRGQFHQLLDAERRLLCTIAWEPVTTRAHDGTVYSRGGRFADYADMKGIQIAHLDKPPVHQSAPERFSLQIGYELPEPLRTLVIASPLALDLMPGI